MFYFLASNVRLMAWAVRLSSVCRLSVCRLWRCCTLGRDLNFSAIFLHRRIAQRIGQFVLKFGAKIRRGSRASCKLNTRGYEILAFLTNISLYFENGTRYGHSYNGRRIGTRMRFIERCHFQWPWVTINLDFKVR